jgi:hypothetical protein
MVSLRAEGVFCCMSRTTAWKHSELNFLTHVEIG